MIVHESGTQTWWVLATTSSNISNGDYFTHNADNNSVANDTTSWSYSSSTDFDTSYTFETSNGSNVSLCFLSGSLIALNNGQKRVEDVVTGDEIVTYVEGVATSQRVTWTGQAHCMVRPNLPDDQAGYPVRVLKDAIADGVPFKDMLITAEHCLFFDGKFTPARMLVNGRSIFFDRSITSYDYYHIETEEHSVIMADGMLTESYLDTGNRRAFRTNDAVIRGLFSSSKDWKTDAAAPLDTSRETVEPLFRQIEARSAQVDGARQTEVRPLTDDSNLHLVTETGAVIRPTRESSGRVMFRLPPDIQSVRIVSSVSRPCDVVGPFVDDRRTLGVLVGEVTLFESDTTRTLTTHLHSDSLPGWNTVEGGTMRWTAGNALLPLGQRSPGSLAMMAIEVKVAGPYLFNDTLPEQQTRHA
ncbi:Hint domain-containing protein [Tanticharoenia sakaeratensis]|nr:Hint domain-containing protein [Tanticharoenia sakaeratensis]